jgi:uncharacterized membrane protein YoaK (UPF0700 family)
MSMSAARARHPTPHDSRIRVRNAAAAALAVTSGATDAIGYLALGHVFTSAMTGNLTLLGSSTATSARWRSTPRPRRARRSWRS